MKASERLKRTILERNRAYQKIAKQQFEIDDLKDTQSRRKDWLSRAKRERGYDDNVSFDHVWKETCEKADAKKD